MAKKINERTLREVHGAIFSSTSQHHAARCLEISPTTLAYHLGKFFHNDTPLTYELLKEISPENGPMVFKELYELVLTAPRVALTKFTLRKIHETIFASANLKSAAGRLGVTDVGLSRHLGRFMHKDAPLTYQGLKAIRPENGPMVFEEHYESLMTTPRVDLTKLTLRKIHETIFASTNRQHAADQLGVADTTLARHLGRFVHNDAPLTYQVLKTIDLKNGPIVFEGHYESLMTAPRVDLTKFTLREIHETIFASTSLQNAADHLGVMADTLLRHLGRFMHKDAPLTYEILKAIHPKIGPMVFEEHYESRMTTPRVDLTKLTLKAIHETIFASTNLHRAAGLLGISCPTLSCHLGRFLHKGTPLTYEILKAIDLKNGPIVFEEHYESLMTAPRVDLKKLTLREIHETIFASTSQRNAAGLLGVADITLANHLGRFVHKGTPMTYEILKTISPENGPKVFEELYESVMTAPRVDLEDNHEVKYSSKRKAADKAQTLYPKWKKRAGSHLIMPSIPDSSALLLPAALPPVNSDTVQSPREYLNASIEGNADFNEPALSSPAHFPQASTSVADNVLLDSPLFYALDLDLPQDMLAQGPDVSATLNITDAILEKGLLPQEQRTPSQSITPLSFSGPTFFKKNSAVEAKQDLINWALQNV